MSEFDEYIAHGEPGQKGKAGLSVHSSESSLRIRSACQKPQIDVLESTKHQNDVLEASEMHAEAALYA